MLPTEIIPLDRFQPHPRNYRSHPKRQVDKLRLSLREFGQVRPVVAQAPARKGDKYTVVAGEGIYIAAGLEKMEALTAAVIPADWPEQKVLAYLAADNETGREGLAEDDDVQLASILEEIRAYDVDLMEAAGYDEVEFRNLMRELGGEDEEAVTLRDVVTTRPPQYAWVVAGLPLTSYGRIAGLVERLAADPETIVITTIGDAMEDNGPPKKG